MARSAKSNAARREKYAALRRLGYSPQQARTSRDSPTSYTRLVEQERKRQPSIRPEGTRQQRYANFARWSGPNGFPEAVDRDIHRINKARGLANGDSYGYRVFFHYYVNRIDLQDAYSQAESQDS